MKNVKKFFATIIMKDGRMYYLRKGQQVPSLAVEDATIFDSEREAIEATNTCFLQKTVYPMAWIIMSKDELTNECSFKSMTFAD